MLYVLCDCNFPSLSPPPHFRFGVMHTFRTNIIKYKENLSISKNLFEISGYNIFKIFILAFGLVTLLCIFFFNTCSQVRYVRFNTNLNLSGQKNTCSKLPDCTWTVSSFMLIMLLNESPEDLCIFLFFSTNPIDGNGLHVTRRLSIILSQILFYTLSVYIFSIASTPGACLLCLVVLQICCHFCAKRLLNWLPFLLI